MIKVQEKIMNKALAYLLLLVYFMGVLPSIIIHHHQGDRVSFAKATLCEKSIYHDSKEDFCSHKEHFSTTIEKCLLCSHHTILPQILFDVASGIKPPVGYFLQYFVFYQNVAAVSVATTTTRGPPLA
ncbi:MAG: hypothetical protein JSS90_08840 [Bacteroidetes bacterium]|jgi:hypothetical protein|nr:hypothetical protein [Bacteroidota bacterium]